MLIEGVQIDVAVNAPEAGTIKEFLANEEDTVTVGQDLVRMELGGAPSGGEKEKASSEPKEPASSEQPTSSDPKPEKKDEPKPKEESPAPEKKSAPEPKKDSPPQKKPEPKKNDAKPAKTDSPLGNREERRVSTGQACISNALLTARTGQDEPHAPAHLRAP